MIVKKAIGNGKVEIVERMTKNGTVIYEAGYKSTKGESREAVAFSEGKLIKDEVVAD